LTSRHPLLKDAIPNVLNVCYADGAAVSRFLPVELPHQRQFCLTENYVLCPTYLRQAASVGLGGRTARRRASPWGMPTFLRRWWAALSGPL